MVDPWALIFWAALVLVLPFHWLLAAALAAAFHELCHLGALRALGGQVYGLHIGLTGAVMEGSLPGRGREILAAAAGPAGSLLLLLLARTAPRVALCGLIQGLFNLLPLYPLDGGRMLRLLLEGRLRRLDVLERCLAVLICLGVLRLHRTVGVLLGIHLIFRNNPCKKGRIGVQ